MRKKGSSGGVRASHTARILFALIIIAVLAYAGVVLNERVSSLRIETAENQAEHERLLALYANQDQIRERARMANFQIGVLEDAFMSNLSLERLLVDTFRLRNVPNLYISLDDTTLALGAMRETPITAAGEPLNVNVVPITIGFEIDNAHWSFNGMQRFISEFERMPITYRVTNLAWDIDESTTRVAVSLEAFGITPEPDERPLVEGLVFAWYSPTIRGRTSLFSTPNPPPRREFARQLFGTPFPRSFYRDFDLTITSHDTSVPSVVFNQVNEFRSMLGSDDTNVRITLTQERLNDNCLFADMPNRRCTNFRCFYEECFRFFYYFTVGNQRFPSTGNTEIMTTSAMDFVIAVTDNTDREQLINLSRVNLTVNNETYKAVRVIGNTTYRLNVTSEGGGVVRVGGNAHD